MTANFRDFVSILPYTIKDPTSTDDSYRTTPPVTDDSSSMEDYNPLHY